jgi:hypothetical protein
MRKNIIILGEEYWFKKTGDDYFKEASTLLQYLDTHKLSKYDYTIIHSPAEFLSTINKIGESNIKALFLFQDVLSDSNLNNKTIMELKELVNSYSSNGIFIYPPLNVIDTFASKNYNKTYTYYFKQPWQN